MAKTYYEIKAEAQAISGASGKGSVTTQMVGGAIEDILNYSEESPKCDGSKTDEDLSFCDEQGNAIAEFKDGHFRTQKFDSRMINGNDTEIADLNVSDQFGNVILELKDGHLRTKEFDSRNCIGNSDVKGYNYIGDRIDVSNYKYSRELLFTESNSSSSSIQGSASFGKYLFQFHNSNDTIDVFNLETKSLVQTIRLTSVSNYHCNNANFGNEYHTFGDKFPLLYVSQENSAVNKCLVYRVTGTEGSFGVNLVQTITFPAQSNDFLWYANCMVDCERGKLIVSGLGNNPWSSGSDNVIRYKVFNLPKLNEGNITLTASQIEDSLEFKNHSTTQGGFVKNANIYQVFGMSNNAELNVIDIIGHRIASHINLTADGLNVEPEGCFLFENSLCINFINKEVYKLKF